MIRYIFPTPVYETICDQSSLGLIQDDLKIVYDDQIKNNLFIDPWRDNKIAVSDNGSFSDNVIERYNLHNFKKFLFEHVQKYLNGCGTPMRDFHYTSWMTRSTKGSYAHIHSHIGADIAGVYYYKAAGVHDGILFFECPDIVYTSFVGIGNVIPPDIMIEPKDGKLLLFPGWLRHGVSTNKSGNERVSVSFNITFKKNV